MVRSLSLPDITLLNPVLSKELRTRMRGGKAFWIQGLYVLVLGFVLSITYLIWYSSLAGSPFGQMMSFRLGRMLYGALFAAQAVMVCLITPALTAGSITIEHEQQTFDMLSTTLLGPRKIILGKLLSAWLFILMLLTTSLPMAALCFLFGGVSPGEIFFSYLLLALCSLFLGAVGLCLSASVNRSMAASVSAYGIAIAFLIGSSAYGSYSAFRYAMGGLAGGGAAIPAAFAAVNPFAAVYYATEKVAVYSFSLPAWLVAGLFFGLATAPLLTGALLKLRHHRAERALILKLEVLLLLGFLLFFGFSDVGQSSAGQPSLYLTIAACAALTLLCLLVPAVVPGDLPTRPRGSLFVWLASGLHPGRIWGKELRSGPAFLLVLWLLTAALLWLGWTLFSFSPPAPIRLPFLPVGAGPKPPLWKLPLGVEAAIGLLAVSLAILAAYAAGAVLLSVLLGPGRARRAGFAIVLALAVFAPMISAIGGLEYGTSGNILSQAGYFSPLIVGDIFSKPSEPSPLWGRSAGIPDWVVGAVIHAAFAVVIFLLAEAAWRARARKPELELAPAGVRTDAARPES
jgi:ABC-type transport system involved in multi-copper enzyme maturation permease subunit